MEKIELTPHDKATLLELHRSVSDKRIADKIKVIIALSEGESHEDIARILLIDKSTQYRYKRMFLDHGIEKLIESKHDSNNYKLNKEQEEQLDNHLSKNPYNSSIEITEYIKETFNINFTPNGFVKTLHRLGYSFKKLKRLPAKADRKKQESFIQKYKKLRDTLNEHKETIYFIDGVHPTHNVMPTYAWIKKGKDKFIKSNTGRKRININGAYSPLDNSVVIREDDRINSESTINLFKQLEEKHKDLDKIHIICDNARYYYSKAVLSYVSKSKIKMHYLPSYSPNLNLIERLWKFFKKKVIYNKYYENFDLFKYTVMQFFEDIDLYNKELKMLMTANFQLFDSS